MKKTSTLLLVALLLSFATLNAQTAGKLYGLTDLGGDSTGGVMFSYDLLTGHDSLEYQFSSYAPVYPNYTYSSVIVGTDGNFYGMSAQGGSADEGVIYKYNPAGRMTVLANFTGPNGQQPRGSLIQAKDGNLYGMAGTGGKYGDGVIFKCTTNGVFDTLVSFNGTNGAEATTNSLIQAADGNLYGMTTEGGKYNDGVIFKCTTAGVLDTLLSFNNRNGGSPWSGLVQGTDNKLYGMSTVGGKFGDGVIFRCSTSGVYDTLASFRYTNGQIPYSTLIEATDGNFYGTTYGGGTDDLGVLFKYDTTTKAIDTLVSFRGKNGEYPVAGVIQATDGNFYGTTLDGGAKNEGVVFEYNTTAKTYDTLVSFTDGVTGEYPISTFIQSNGNLYGLTWEGGTGGYGTLFQCTTGGTLSVVYNIGETYLGYNPVSSLIQASDGYFYGTSNSSYQSNNGNGTVFRCLPSGADMTTLAVFTGGNGLNPYGKLLQASDGNLYGMAHGGGKYGDGVIYKYTLPGGTFDTLVSFNNTNGAFPWGNLIQGYDGNFYGLTSGGGTDEEGTIFKCTPSGVITVFHSFTGSDDGQSPYGSLIQGKDSVLYGLTRLGGGGGTGTVFKCTTSGNYTLLNGAPTYPYGSFVQATDGNLYGLTQQGGNNSDGSLFKCTTSGTVTTLVSFNGTNGNEPQGTLIQAADSNLYGMASYGGKYGYGVVFKYSISLNVFDTLFSFNGANGRLPEYGNLLEISSIPTNVLSLSTNHPSLSIFPNPTTGLINITSTKNIDRLTVTNLLGQIVFTTSNSRPNTNSNSTIDLSEFDDGMYFVTVTSGDAITTAKVIVNK